MPRGDVDPIENRGSDAGARLGKAGSGLEVLWIAESFLKLVEEEVVTTKKNLGGGAGTISSLLRNNSIKFLSMWECSGESSRCIPCGRLSTVAGL